MVQALFEFKTVCSWNCFFFTPVVFANVDIWSSKKWKSTDHFDHSCTILIQFVFKVHVSFKKIFFHLPYPLALMLKLPYGECYLGFSINTKKKKHTQKVCIEPSKPQHTSQVSFKCLIDFRGEYFPHNALCYICPAMLINLNFWSINKVTFLPNCQLGPF